MKSIVAAVLLAIGPCSAEPPKPTPTKPPSKIEVDPQFKHSVPPGETKAARMPNKNIHMTLKLLPHERYGLVYGTTITVDEEGYTWIRDDEKILVYAQDAISSQWDAYIAIYKDAEGDITIFITDKDRWTPRKKDNYNKESKWLPVAAIKSKSEIKFKVEEKK